MSDHVAQVCRSCYFQLCQLCHVRCSVTPDAVKTFISSRLDYCNSLLTAMVYATVYWGNCSHSKMPLLVWLPTHGNLTKSNLRCAICNGFQLADELCSKPPCWFTRVSVCGLAPSYLSEFCRPVSTLPGRQHLRSGTTGIKNKDVYWSIGNRRFAVASPVTWNSLPTELRTLQLSVPSFVQRLKTYVFNSYWLQPAAHLVLPRF